MEVKANFIQKKKPMSISDKISLFIAVIYLCFSLSGFTHESYRYISAAFLGIWIMSALYCNIDSFVAIHTERKIIAFWIYIVFFFLTGSLNGDLFYIFKSIGDNLVLFSAMFMFSYYKKANKLAIIRKIVILTGLFLIALSITAIAFYQINPNAAREIASDYQYYGIIAIGGGYGLAYGAAIIAVYLFDILLNKVITNRKKKIMLIMIILIAAYLVIETRSTVTLLCMFAGLVLSIILKQPKSNITRRLRKKGITFPQFATIMAVCFLALIYFLSYEQIGLWIIDNTSNSDNILLMRIAGIGEALAYGSGGTGGADYVEGRFSVPLRSVYAFLDSPIIGRGYEYGYNYILSSEFIGNHGEWADALGSMGLFGGIPFLLIFWNAVKEERYLFKRYIPATYAITLLMLGMFNPFRTFQSLFVILFLIPATGLLIKNACDVEK